LNFQQSLVLGVIQGLTEFIPVSSTAHLILAPRLISTQLEPTYPHTFDTVIQIGTVFPVLLYFWKDWFRLLLAGGRILKKFRVGDDPDERMVKYLFFGSIPAGALGVLLESKIEKIADSHSPTTLLLIGAALIVVGLLMWWAESHTRRVREIEHLRTPDAWLIGLGQALALWPGVSRSGATITAGLFAGLTREAAARFSFLLMTPIMIAVTAYKGLKLVTGIEPMTPGEWQTLFAATGIAALTGYFAIAFLLTWLRTRSLAIFAVYRVLLGSFCIGMYFMQR
jgi:undecaprenyl-diphosphatase